MSGRETWTTVVLLRAGTEIASWPLGGHGRVTVDAVDDLARLQLWARRIGCDIQLRGACGGLWELIDLAGLAAVVAREGALVVEVGGNPERGEQVIVQRGQEGVEPGDAVT
ncbi:MAG: hypothetical protein ACYDH6_02965 [Acidimicrobiales bacterium]